MLVGNDGNNDGISTKHVTALEIQILHSFWLYSSGPIQWEDSEPFFSLSTTVMCGELFHFFVNNLQFCCKISGLVENVFHLAELGGAVLIYWIP